MNDMLDSDVASVTQLKLSDTSGIVTGTAPFDGDDNPGDDSSSTNKIVRSFDKITYNYDFAVNPDDPLAYYRSARVGFRFELPISSDKASFDLDAMNWVDQTPGYQPQSTTETIGGVQTQVLSVYRLMSPTSTSPTAVPGAAGITLGINVKAAVQGDVIQPKVTAWAAPNDVHHRSMSNTPAAVTVSAKLNMNLRITGVQNEVSPEMSFDFNKTNPSFLNYGLGKRTGMMAMVNWAVDMRWHDQSKGLRGLEKPQGDVTFSISASSQWKKNGASASEPARADLQPYFWDYGPVTQGNPFHDSGRDTRSQGWYPRLDNYHYARSARGDPSDSVYQNGDYNIGQDRQSDKTVFQFKLSNYDINGTFPYFGDAHNVDACSNVLMSEGCVTQRVGEISTGYLYVFFPSSIPDSSSPNGQKNVVDLYGGTSMSLQSRISDGGLSADSVTPGDKLRQPTSTSDVSNQAASDDDSWSASTLLNPPGQFSNYFYYSCPKSNTDRENGTDCGTWEASDWQHGTDTAMAGTTARIFSASEFDTGIRGLPVGELNLVKIDPTVLEVPEKGDLDLHVADASKSQGTAYWNDWESTPVFGKKGAGILYATKKDGSSWSSDSEQFSADIKDLNFYDTKAEAQSHGTIVAMLFVGYSAADTSKAGHYSVYNVGSFKAQIKPNVPIGTVAQVTQRAYAFTRSQLADAGKAVLKDGTHLDPMTSSDAQWEQLANEMDPMALRATLAPKLSAPGSGSSYEKARYDSQQGYLGNDTGGIEYGDSLYVAGEQPKVDKTVEQKSEAGGTKSIYDLDKDQRTVDWALTGSVSGAGTSGLKTEAYVTDTLPKGLHYVYDSAKLGGTYQAGGAQGGTVTGGTSLAPTVTANADGTTTLKWIVSDVPADGSKFVIHYQSSIGDASDPNSDAQNGESYANTVGIQSKRNMAKPDGAKGTLVNASIKVSRTHASSIAILADPLTADVSQQLGFKMMLGNMAPSQKNNPYAVNIMPFNGGTPVSNFHGSYKVTGIKVSGSAGASVAASVHPRVFFSTDTSLRSRTPSSVTRAEILSNPSVWHEGTVDNATGEVTIPSGYDAPVAWAFMSDVLPSNARYDFKMDIKPNGNHASDLYTDEWMNDTNMVIARSAVVRRSVSGIAWYDYNSDGIRGADDKTLAGVKVALVDANGNPVNSLADGTTPLTATTGADGSYRMDNVPAGSGYRLVFKPASADGWKPFKVTVKDNPDAQMSERSRADADQGQTSGDPLRSASIALADFPAVSAMHSAAYDDTYENAGITGKLPVAPSLMANGFKVQKVLNGRTGAWLSGEEYTFDIEAQGSAPAAGANGPVPSSVTVMDGSVKTVPVDGTKFALPGTYVYKVTEHATNQHGVTPDTATSQSYLVTVTVADDMATMTRTVTTSMKDDRNADVSSDTATFTNQYKAAPVSVTPGGSKVLVSTPGNSHAPLAAGEFGFVLSEASRPAGAAAIADQHATNAADGSITFPSMTFDHAGTYKFQMTEDTVSDVHISRDPTVYTLTYTVTDDQANGQLVASAPAVTSDPSGSSTAKFTNVYDPAKSVFEIKASKSMGNIDPATHRAPAAGEFQFKLEAVNGTRAVDGASVAKADVPMPSAASGSAIEMTNQADGSVAFGGMQYAYPGVFNYKVSEVVPSGSAKDATLDYDTRVYDVAVTVTDVAGTLTAVSSVSLDGAPAAGNAVAFDNKYTPAPVDVSLDAKKTMAGRPLVDGEFSALLAPVAGNPVNGGPANGSQEKSVAKVTNSEGSVSFDSLRFTRVGDWNYTITEKPGTLGGVAYDGTVHDVLVHVTEDATSHKLMAQVTLSHDGIAESAVTLHNAYTPAPVSDVVDAEKKVAPSAGNSYQLKSGDFSFTLHRVSAPVGANAQADVSASNAADGRVVLPAVSMDRAGDYVFTLSEDSTAVPGITRDPAVYSVTYHVTDDLRGHLVISSKTLAKLGASGSSSPASSAVFTNAYDPRHVAVSLGGVKSVRNTDSGTHRVPANGEFEFSLTALDGTDASGVVAANQVPMPSGASHGKSTVENVGPAFTFGSIEYAHPGTYRYRIREVAGHDSSIGYDGRSYVVTVTVTDVAGALSASTDKSVSDVLFENVYTPAAVDADLNVGKVLDGRALEDGEFGVVLTPSNGNPDHGGTGALAASIDRVNTAAPAGSPVLLSSVSPVDLQGQGRARFSMRFSHTGVWHYTLTEVAGAEHGVTYDRTPYGVTVRVTEDAASHRLVASVALDRNGSPVDAVVFHNEYRPDPAGPNGRLGRTGDDVMTVVALGLMLLLAGGSLVLVRRRRA